MRLRPSYRTATALIPYPAARCGDLPSAGQADGVFVRAWDLALWDVPLGLDAPGLLDLT